MRIGFIGLGIMGRPMAGHLLRAGFPLTVWNRTPGKTDELIRAGARAAKSPAALAAESDVVMTIVTDGPDVEEVLFAPRGVVEGFAESGRLSRRGGQAGAGERGVDGAGRPVVIDLSTVSPRTARRIATRLAQDGLDFLDAPVTGGDVGAQNATLTIMVGGEAAVFERCRGPLSAMGRKIVHVGPNGAGQMVKACNQILCAVNMIAVCESLSLARRTGLDVNAMLDVVTSGAGGSWALEHLGRKIVAGDLRPAFMVRLIQKDLRAVMEAAEEARLPLPGTALAIQLFRAVEAGGGDALGTQAMIQAYERMAGES
ncbi:MAG: NAD(P)-dependent oxidoreductase [Phycisphaerae bacterium]|nr:NAD(P)-dependent oxidoreductase [Phycisphaerae bacterium]